MSDFKHYQDIVSEHGIEFVDLRFTDTKGKEQHVSIPVHAVSKDFFLNGKMFDGSSIEGWKGINESDMILMPNISNMFLDPFFKAPTLVIRCDILDPETMYPYNRDPRSIAKRCEYHIKSTGIADSIFFGPEPEFFIFDDVTYQSNIEGSEYKIRSIESSWGTNDFQSGRNNGHRPSIKGGYFPVPPIDTLQDIRSEICNILKGLGQKVEVHHHEVATAGQCEIGTEFSTLVDKADQTQVFKYVVHNVANRSGKSATFMPKPLLGDNGSGMHVHQSLYKDGKNLFSGDGYSGLSEKALYYIGGIIKHAKALNAFCNPSTNSYKRLVPGFEAPVLLAYSSRNRSASIRIPFVNNSKACRIEVRFGDPSANVYLAFSAMAMAGIDGIKNKIHPGKPIDKNLYDLSPKDLKNIPTVANSLRESLKSLDEDRGFLTAGEVFSNDMIDSYIQLKMNDIQKLNTTPHPVEFDMYYSL